MWQGQASPWFPKAFSASRPPGCIMLVSNGNSFIAKSFFAFVNRSLLWCFITHLEDVLGSEHCLQKYLFYHLFINRLFSTRSSQIPACSKARLMASGLLVPCVKWTSARCSGQRGLLPTHHSLCRSSLHGRKTSRKTSQHFQSLSALAPECDGVMFLFVLFCFFFSLVCNLNNNCLCSL